MNELCSYYQPHLPLYAEGELRDSYLSERIEIHLQFCSECRETVEEYSALTDRVLALASPNRSFLPRGRDGAESGTPASGAVPLRPGSGSPSSPEFADLERMERIMAAVYRLAARRRRRTTYRRLAAAVILGLSLGGLMAYLGGGGGTAPGDSLVARGPSRGTVNLRRASGEDRLDPWRRNAPDALDPRLHVIRWVLQDSPEHRLAARSRPRDAVRLLGVVSPTAVVAGEPAEEWVRWILDARLEEWFRDPLGGGWVYLVPDSAGPSTAPRLERGPREAIPVRRLALQESRGQERLAKTIREGQRPRYFRLVVIPDAEARGEVLFTRSTLLEWRPGASTSELASDDFLRRQIPSQLEPLPRYPQY